MTEPGGGDFVDVGLSALHAVSWSIYVGGAICMELVLRYAQVFMKPSQTAVVCEFSGRRYRWWSCICLTVLLLTGVLLALRSNLPLAATTGPGLTIGMLMALWLVQVGILVLLSFRIHPDMHARLAATMSPEEMQRERARVGVAIIRMDRTVRFELVVALVAMFLGASLHSGIGAGG